MKKVLLLFFSFATYTSKAQYRGSIYHPQALQKLEALSKKYFGHNPFQTGLPKLLDFICQDTAVYVDTVTSHTDTSNFYIRAHHKQFNPFGIGLDSVRIIVAERKRGVLSSKQIIDTVYYLQTEGIAVGQNQVRNLRTAFQRMHK